MSQKPPSQRQRRVNEELRHSLADVLQRRDIPDQVLDSTPVTVSEVRVSPDLKNATAFVMPLGGLRKEEVLKALENRSPMIRTMVAQRMRLKYCPRFSFRLDESFEQAHRVQEILNREGVAPLERPGDEDR